MHIDVGAAGQECIHIAQRPPPRPGAQSRRRRKAHAGLALGQQRVNKGCCCHGALRCGAQGQNDERTFFGADRCPSNDA